MRLWGLALVIAILGLVWPTFGHAQTPSAEVLSLRADRFDDGIVVAMSLRIELPAAVQEALSKGIPVYFVADVEVFRDRWYWTDKRLVTASRTWRLAFQPLTQRWRLNVSTGPTSLTQHFDSLTEALATMSRVSRWRVADAPDVDPDGRHNVEIRFRLDTTQLPRPFQMGLLGQPEWSISASKYARVNMSPAPDAQR